METTKRFEEAIELARELPSTLLSRDQKLKLFALFKQADGPAPPDPCGIKADGSFCEAEHATELEIAKWEAWNDARKLTTEQAMRSYAQIIEGLVEMLEEQDAMPKAKPPAAVPADDEGEEEEYEEEEDEGEEDEGEDEGEVEPQVEATIWSTSSLSLGPGSTFEVPLTVVEPSLCTYSFSIVTGSGPIGFGLKSAEGTELVAINESTAEGKVDALATGLLRATLDNTASTFMTVTVKCQVALEPLSQLATLKAFRERAALKKELRKAIDALEDQTQLLEDLGYEKSQLGGRLAQLDAERAEVLTALGDNTGQAEAATQKHMELRAAVESLWGKLETPRD